MKPLGMIGGIGVFDPNRTGRQRSIPFHRRMERDGLSEHHSCLERGDVDVGVNHHVPAHTEAGRTRLLRLMRGYRSAEKSSSTAG